jgi:hypothetical protein
VSCIGGDPLETLLGTLEENWEIFGEKRRVFGEKKLTYWDYLI